MERTYIKDVKNNLGQTITIKGFVDSIRDTKYVVFMTIKDITGTVQATVEKETNEELAASLEGLTNDSVVTITGKAVENEYVKLHGYEVIPDEVIIESIADALPINRKEITATKKKKAVERSSIDQRIDYRWIDLRTDENQMMFKVQTVMVNAMRKYLLENNFIEIHTPKLIGTAGGLL